MRENCDNCGRVCRIGDLGLCVSCEKDDTGVPDVYASNDILDEDDAHDYDWGKSRMDAE